MSLETDASHFTCSNAEVATNHVFFRSTQPGHPFVEGAKSICQRAVTPCGWGVKAGMVHVWVAGKMV